MSNQNNVQYPDDFCVNSRENNFFESKSFLKVSGFASLVHQYDENTKPVFCRLYFGSVSDKLAEILQWENARMSTLFLSSSTGKDSKCRNWGTIQ